MTDLPVPTTLPEFTAAFPDEQACVEYLFNVRWPEGFVCPKCGDTHGSVITTRALVECRNGHQTSVTAGTLFHGTRLPLRTWFYGAFLVATLKPGISALQFQGQLGITRYETAYQMLHKLRSALVAPDRDRLRGEVEVDEAYIGGVEPGRPGRGAVTKSIVMVAVEVIRYPAKGLDGSPIEKMRAGRIRMGVVPDLSAETLVPWVVANVEEGSTVLTDGNAAYNGLKALGYEHQRVFASRKRISTGQYLPLVHLIIVNLKTWLRGTFKGAVRSKHRPAYLNEFVFRFNRRFWRGPAFGRVMEFSARATKRPEYKTLYGVGTPGGWRHPNPRGAPSGQQVEAIWTAILTTAAPPLQAWLGAHETAIRERLRVRMEAS